jgi:hypothetical protein
MKKSLYQIGFAAAVAIIAVAPVQAQQGVSVKMDRAACLELMRAPEVPSATYVPGVDAYGRAVTPAEGAGSSSNDWVTDAITIVLSVDLAKRYGIGNNGTSFGADAAIGQVTLRNGQVMMNGRPLMTSDEAGMRAACKQMGITRK